MSWFILLEMYIGHAYRNYKCALTQQSHLGNLSCGFPCMCVEWHTLWHCTWLHTPTYLSVHVSKILLDSYSKILCTYRKEQGRFPWFGMVQKASNILLRDKNQVAKQYCVQVFGVKAGETRIHITFLRTYSILLVYTKILENFHLRAKYTGYPWREE